MPNYAVFFAVPFGTLVHAANIIDAADEAEAVERGQRIAAHNTYFAAVLRGAETWRKQQGLPPVEWSARLHTRADGTQTDAPAAEATAQEDKQ